MANCGAGAVENVSDNDTPYKCPNCGATDGTPVYWDNGICAQTGYHDAGEGCTRCILGGER